MIKNSISSSPLKVVFMGTPVFSIKPLQELINSRHSVEAIYTQPPENQEEV
jgi:methionyl-tRNA formyltransferase